MKLISYEAQNRQHWRHDLKLSGFVHIDSLPLQNTVDQEVNAANKKMKLYTHRLVSLKPKSKSNPLRGTYVF